MGFISKLSILAIATGAFASLSNSPHAFAAAGDLKPAVNHMIDGRAGTCSGEAFLIEASLHNPEETRLVSDTQLACIPTNYDAAERNEVSVKNLSFQDMDTGKNGGVYGLSGHVKVFPNGIITYNGTVFVGQERERVDLITSTKVPVQIRNGIVQPLSQTLWKNGMPDHKGELLTLKVSPVVPAL
ncbi:hypothetical protein AA14337_2883 [Acetobacter malorum DSM 14337]|uniref:Uncharacterized protein n=2 Tax=Acetobacter malorum TaxID=178901 RepID=A0ABQ0PYC4_9PROT|nr:hypothetical protein [Acetobacter malorum]KXV06811.1 hypothetical protein AD930_06850 [Acetobacter malorum]GBQ84672.1 hypothetical protein AA14337_2883 [Acetobacter malorum DSM 14337]